MGRGGEGGPGHACGCLLHIQDHLLFLFQQQQLQQLSQHASPIPLPPHPSSMQPPSLSGASGASGLLALSGALMAQLATKEDRVAQDGENTGKGKKHSWVNPLKGEPWGWEWSPCPGQGRFRQSLVGFAGAMPRGLNLCSSVPCLPWPGCELDAHPRVQGSCCLLCLFAEAPGCCMPGDGKSSPWNGCSPKRLVLFVTWELLLCSDAVCATLALGKCLCTHRITE